MSFKPISSLNIKSANTNQLTLAKTVPVQTGIESGKQIITTVRNDQNTGNNNSIEIKPKNVIFLKFFFNYALFVFNL